MLLKSNIQNLGLIILTSITLSTCKKDNYEDVPYVPVNITLYYPEISSIGVGMVVSLTPDSTDKNYSVIDYFDVRFPKKQHNQRVYGNGLIIYRYSDREFLVFDRTCTYKPRTDICSLTLLNRSTLPICPCCKSVFLLDSDGFPATNSKATRPLHLYNSYFTNNFTQLVITN